MDEYSKTPNNSSHYCAIDIIMWVEIELKIFQVLRDCHYYMYFEKKVLIYLMQQKMFVISLWYGILWCRCMYVYSTILFEMSTQLQTINAITFSCKSVEVLALLDSHNVRLSGTVIDETLPR